MLVPSVIPELAKTSRSTALTCKAEFDQEGAAVVVVVCVVPCVEVVVVVCPILAGAGVPMLITWNPSNSTNTTATMDSPSTAAILPSAIIIIGSKSGFCYIDIADCFYCCSFVGSSFCAILGFFMFQIERISKVDIIPLHIAHGIAHAPTYGPMFILEVKLTHG